MGFISLGDGRGMSVYRLAVPPAVALVITVVGNLLYQPAPERDPSVEASDSVAVSMYPAVFVTGATPGQHRRLAEGLDRFRQAGLELPDLQVEFAAAASYCGEHLGRFEPRFSPWRIVICSDLDAVYEHELAHAWELANLDDHTRRQFVEYRGYEVWNDPASPWVERGIEGAAFIIQQGLVDLPLPPTLSAENHSRLVAYTILTGQPAPRLLRWIGLDAN
jgi:hypothetical protein